MKEGANLVAQSEVTIAFGEGQFSNTSGFLQEPVE